MSDLLLQLDSLDQPANLCGLCGPGSGGLGNCEVLPVTMCTRLPLLICGGEPVTIQQVPEGLFSYTYQYHCVGFVLCVGFVHCVELIFGLPLLQKKPSILGRSIPICGANCTTNTFPKSIPNVGIILFCCVPYMHLCCIVLVVSG